MDFVKIKERNYIISFEIKDKGTITDSLEWFIDLVKEHSTDINNIEIEEI